MACDNSRKGVYAEFTEGATDGGGDNSGPSGPSTGRRSGGCRCCSRAVFCVCSWLRLLLRLLVVLPLAVLLASPWRCRHTGSDDSVPPSTILPVPVTAVIVVILLSLVSRLVSCSVGAATDFPNVVFTSSPQSLVVPLLLLSLLPLFVVAQNLSPLRESSSSSLSSSSMR